MICGGKCAEYGNVSNCHDTSRKFSQAAQLIFRPRWNGLDDTAVYNYDWSYRLVKTETSKKTFQLIIGCAKYTILDAMSCWFLNFIFILVLTYFS
jgi:hypothetical protein